MTTKMIALVGEQPIPNLLPIRHVKPVEVLLVRTDRTKQVSERLEKVIKQEVGVHFCQVDPYDIAKIYTKLTEKIEGLKWSTSEIILNLTGGTKPMAFAAYQLAVNQSLQFMYLESEKGQSRLRRYEFKGDLPVTLTDEVIFGVVSIQDYLTAHLSNFSQSGFSKDKSGQLNDGGRFEKSLHDYLRPHIDEIVAGIRPYGSGVEEIEIDLVVRCGNQVGIIEAKTDTVTKRAIEQLALAGGRAYLGTYTAKFLIVGRKTRPEMKNLAAAREITVIELPGYTEGRPLPKKEADLMVRIIRQKLGATA